MATALLSADDMLTAAADARTAVQDTLRAFDLAAADLGYGYVAELLDLDEQTLRRRLDGDLDMTLTEMRQLAIATGLSLRIETAPVEFA